jgi:hypothetical protein
MKRGSINIWSRIEEEKSEEREKELLKERGEVDVEDQELNTGREERGRKNKSQPPPSLLRPLPD